MIAFDRLPEAERNLRLTQGARALLAAYDLPAGSAVTLVNVSENATFRIAAGAEGDLALRIHRAGYHSRLAIASELDWVMAIRRDTSIVTPEPVAGHDGQLIQTRDLDGVGRRDAVMFRWEAGIEPPADDLEKPFVTLGAVTAGMHAHARRYRRPEWFTRLTWDFDGAFGPQPHWGRWQAGLGMDAALERLFARALDLVARRLQRFGKDPQRFGLAHCDMRLANLLLDGATTKVIDFDDCGFSWFLYDFATAISFIEDRSDIPALREAWITGYRSVAPLSDDEARELDTFVIFRRLLLVAWIGSHAETDLARAMGPAYAAGSATLCERYLSVFG